MPRLWDETIEAHRREVRRAIMAAAVQLATRHGPLKVTMSQVAETAGIGRPTLYKYFSSVEEILHAWHDQQIGHHLAELAELADRDIAPLRRLRALLETYARIQRRRRGHDPHDLAGFLHRDEQVSPAERALHELVVGTLEAAIAQGDVRADVRAPELATFCLHALGAARDLPSSAAVRRLVDLVLAALQAEHLGGGSSAPPGPRDAPRDREASTPG